MAFSPDFHTQGISRIIGARGKELHRSYLPSTKWILVFFAITLIIIAADQASKDWIRASFYLGQALPETGFFRLVYAQNTGAAFSMFYGNNGILSVVAMAELIIILCRRCVPMLLNAPEVLTITSISRTNM